MNLFQTLKEKYLRRKARLKLINQYEYLGQVDNLLEEYMTEKILQGGNEEFMAKGRSNLANKQQEIRTNTEFLKFLKNAK